MNMIYKQREIKKRTQYKKETIGNKNVRKGKKKKKRKSCGTWDSRDEDLHCIFVPYKQPTLNALPTTHYN